MGEQTRRTEIRIETSEITIIRARKRIDPDERLAEEPDVRAYEESVVIQTNEREIEE